MYIDSAAPAELKNQAQGLVMLLTNGIGLFLSNLVFYRLLEDNLVSSDPVRHAWTEPFGVAFIEALAVALAFILLFHPKKSKC